MTALRLVPVRDDDPPPDSLVEACKAILLAPFEHGIERHDVPGEQPGCVGQWCCGCDVHPIGKPWGWNHEAWEMHNRVSHPQTSDPGGSPATEAPPGSPTRKGN